MIEHNERQSKSIYTCITFYTFCKISCLGLHADVGEIQVQGFIALYLKETMWKIKSSLHHKFVYPVCDFHNTIAIQGICTNYLLQSDMVVSDYE